MRPSEVTSPSPDSLKRGYEEDHIRLRWIVAFFVCFVLSAVAIDFGVWGVMQWFAHYAREDDLPRSIVHATPKVESPPIQPSVKHDSSPADDLALMRKKENDVFEKMGWKKDETTGDYDPPPSLIAKLSGGGK